MNTKPLGPFLGVNNRRPDFDMSVRTRDIKGDYVRDAVDVLLTGSGTFKSRKSADLILPMVNAHSMFEDYYVLDRAIFRIHYDTLCENLVHVLSTDAHGDWERIGDTLYFSNGIDCLRITADDEVFPWGMPAATGWDVALAPSPGNGMMVGMYQVTVAYYNDVTGEIGPTAPSVSCAVENSNQDTVHISLPPAHYAATHVKVYVSEVSGTTPYLHSTVPFGVAQTIDLGVPSDEEPVPARDVYEKPLPAGDQLFYHNGRLCSISGGNIYYGLPWRHGYYEPLSGYVPFPADVSVAMSAQNGVYVAADKTYWFPGDLAKLDDKVQDVLPYGAVKGSTFSAPNKSLYGWFGEKGLVLAGTNGEVEAVMSDNITLTPPASGVSFIVEDADSRRVISCGWCVNLDTNAVTRYSGYDFNSTNGQYALNSDGLYNLLGAVDVVGTVSLGKHNFGTEALSHMPAVYLGAASALPMELTVGCLDKTGAHVSYTYPARKAGSLALRRVDPGKGLRANWFDLTLNAVNFTLATVSFATVESKRRI